jgi:serine/threonine-protein kinase
VRVDAAVARVRETMTRSNLWRVALSSAATLFMGAGVAATLVWFATRPMPPRLARTTIATSGSMALTLQGVDRDVAITPDGSTVVYRGDNQLLVRPINRLEPAVLISGGAPEGPFVSPDGQWVGFFDGTGIRKVSITGGPPITIVAGRDSGGRGATWGADGTIIFGTATDATALQRVSEAGGTPAVLTTADFKRGDADHVWPEFLPGGKAVLFTIRNRHTGNDNASIAVLDLRTGVSTVLIRGGSDAHYVSTGHVVYGFAGTLRAVAFDLERLEIVGAPTPVLEGVLTTAQGAADVAIAADGSLVYVPGVATGGSQRTVAWVDRQGRSTPLANVPLDEYRDVRISPDGLSLAVATEADVWIYTFMRGVLSRLTTDPAQDRSPLWTPDGNRVVFTSTRAGSPQLFSRAADGTGNDTRLFARATDLVDLRANGFSANGRYLLFTEVPTNIQNAIGQFTIGGESDATMMIKNTFNNDFASVSAGGDWVAYQSTTSGRSEIYVERYPQLGHRQQISTEGGRLPLWSRDGRELFFSSPDGRHMVVMPIDTGTTPFGGRPRILFEYPMLLQSAGNRPYDIAPDGRFVMIRGETENLTGPAQNLVLVQNWFEQLKRLAPTK